MKKLLFVLIPLYLFMSTTMGFAEDITFSGNFTERSFTHSFTITENSEVDVKLSSGCSDEDSSFYLKSTDMYCNVGGISDPVDGVWYDYRLAHGNYELKVSCNNYSNQPYEATIRTALGSMYDADEEPNNATWEAIPLGSLCIAEGHLGFVCNEGKSVYGIGDPSDYYKKVLSPGKYYFRLSYDYDKFYDVNVGGSRLFISVKNEDTSWYWEFTPLKSGDDSPEFNITQQGEYFIALIADSGYGGYRFQLFDEENCGLTITNVEADDNVCGNTQTATATLTNTCAATTFSGFEVSVIVEGPTGVMVHELIEGITTLEASSSIQLRYDWTIPKRIPKGLYEYCFEGEYDPSVFSDDPDFSSCETYGILCYIPVNYILYLLLLKPGP